MKTGKEHIKTALEISKVLNVNGPIKVKDVLSVLGLKLTLIDDIALQSKKALGTNTCPSFLDVLNNRIYVLSGMSETRTRMSIFHEVGHYVLQHKRHTIKQENEAYEFACELMMPKYLLKEDVGKAKELTFEMIDAVSKKYIVSMEASAIWLSKVFHLPYALMRVEPLGCEYNGGEFRKIFAPNFQIKSHEDLKLLGKLKREVEKNNNSVLKSKYFYKTESFKSMFPDEFPIYGNETIESSWVNKKDTSGYIDFNQPNFKKLFASCRYLKESDSVLVLMKEE